MVQVGCTINYGRSSLWKQTKELQSPSPERISILVGFPASVLSAPTQSLHVPGLFSAHSATFSLRPRRLKAFDWRRLSRFVFSSHQETAHRTNPTALTISAQSARINEVTRIRTIVSSSGPVAQLGARFHGMEVPNRPVNDSKKPS
jgi:hypothetical protein